MKKITLTIDRKTIAAMNEQTAKLPVLLREAAQEAQAHIRAQLTAGMQRAIALYHATDWMDAMDEDTDE